MYGPIDSQLLLRDIGDGAETASADEAGVAFDPAAHTDFKVVFHVSALDTADADETYDLVVDVDSEVAFGDTPVEVASLTVTAPGTYEIPLSGAFIGYQDADAAAIRVGAVLAGTTPSITYGAYIAPVN
ncbi:MAG: hypothetical protein ACPGO3_05500 [Magnetospiraceae bacterium]